MNYFFRRRIRSVIRPPERITENPAKVYAAFPISPVLVREELAPRTSVDGFGDAVGTGVVFLSAPRTPDPGVGETAGACVGEGDGEGDGEGVGDASGFAI